MNPLRLMPSTAAITYPTGSGADDGMGDPTMTTATVSYRCAIWQGTRNEDTDNRATAFEEWQIAVEPDGETALTAASTLVVDGSTFQVYGPPWPARNLRTGVIEHIEATLRKTA
jgi:hypothetical protein